MIIDVVAVAISFFALGGVLFFSALLLLLNPRGRSVRWHMPFQVGLLLWLLGQGMASAGGGHAWGILSLCMAVALPGLFLTFGMVERLKTTRWATAGVLGSLAIAVAFVAALRGGTPPVVSLSNGLLWVWMVSGWTGGALLIWARVPGRSAPARREKADIPLALVLAAAAPVCVGLAFLLSARGFTLYAMPPITVALDFLVFVGIARHQYYDIEVRVRRSGELAADAAEGERLAIVGELAAVVAHEVRNPLTGVRSLAQRLAEEDVDDERRRRWAGVILEETSRVERLVSNLLEIARRAPRPVPGQGATPLGPLFDDLALLAGARAARGGVALDVQAADLVAGAPREPLAQATLNLLLNAIAHSPAGGHVRLSAAREDGGVCIRVADQGPGVPPEERERIFDPFHSGTPGGTGLGLSVVRRLARELEWRVEVGDAAGGGAEFRIHLTEAGVA